MSIVGLCCSGSAWRRRWQRVRSFLLWLCMSWQCLAVIGRGAINAPSSVSDIVEAMGVFQLDPLAIAHPQCYAGLQASPIAFDVLEVAFALVIVVVFAVAWLGLRDGYVRGDVRARSSCSFGDEMSRPAHRVAFDCWTTSTRPSLLDALNAAVLNRVSVVVGSAATTHSLFPL